MVKLKLLTKSSAAFNSLLAVIGMNEIECNFYTFIMISNQKYPNFVQLFAKSQILH